MARASAAPLQRDTARLVMPLRQATAEIQRACAGIRSLSACSDNHQQYLTYSQVIVSLATLQSAVSDLSRAYINHANTVLNRGPVSTESSLTSGLAGGLASSLLENGLLGGAVAHHALVQEPRDEKKKRKRAPHDPNAPKRALTPYFLYMQHNRAQIASELGTEAKPKDVADEGTRRWATMKDDDKEVWKKLYLDNLAVYKAKMTAYKAGLPIPEDDNAQADSQLQQSVAAEAEAEEESESEDSEDDSEEEESTKEPTPPPSKQRRRAKAPASPVVAKKASPEKKKPTPVAKKDNTPVGKAFSTPSQTKRSKKKARKSEGGAGED